MFAQWKEGINEGENSTEAVGNTGKGYRKIATHNIDSRSKSEKGKF